MSTGGESAATGGLSLSRPAFFSVLIAHILFVWGGIGLLGEFWIKIPFCTAARFEPVGFCLIAMWIASTVSPLLGIFSAIKQRFLNQYLMSVALTLFTYWLIKFLTEIRVTTCDSL